MKVLVTGASGFIGSTLIEELTTQGLQVRALMRKTSSPANLKDLSFERIEGDLNDYDSLRCAVAGVDYVFHLAGLVTARDRASYFEANLNGTERLARAVSQVNPLIKRFVYVSSLAAGGPTKTLAFRAESHPDQPVSNYGHSKLESERALLQFRELFPITIIRPPIVYGPKDKATFILIQTVKRGFVPVFKGATSDRNKYYSSIHVQDLCRGIWQGAQADLSQVPSGEIFYLASDQSVTYLEFMNTIARKLGRNPLKLPMPKFALVLGAWGMTAVSQLTRKTYPLNLDKLNELFPDYWICSNAKAKKMLGFQPQFDFENGMAHTIEWYQKERWIS